MARAFCSLIACVKRRLCRRFFEGFDEILTCFSIYHIGMYTNTYKHCVFSLTDQLVTENNAIIVIQICNIWNDWIVIVENHTKCHKKEWVARKAVAMKEKTWFVFCRKMSQRSGRMSERERIYIHIIWSQRYVGRWCWIKGNNNNNYILYIIFLPVSLNIQCGIDIKTMEISTIIIIFDIIIIIKQYQSRYRLNSMEHETQLFAAQWTKIYFIHKWWC